MKKAPIPMNPSMNGWGVFDVMKGIYKYVCVSLSYTVSRTGECALYCTDSLITFSQSVFNTKMPQKLTAKSKKKENSGIPRVKPQEVAVSLDQFVKKKSRPLIPIVDETKWFRQQKRDEKREKQRRNDVAKSAEAHLEKAIDSFKVMSTESE